MDVANLSVHIKIIYNSLHYISMILLTFDLLVKRGKNEK